MATVFAGEDHHVVLGVGPDASQAQIKRAYYGLARVLHPDKNANEPEEATKMMQRVNEAFQALTPAKTCRSCEPYGSPARSQWHRNTSLNRQSRPIGTLGIGVCTHPLQ